MDRLSREFERRSVDEFYEVIGNGDLAIGKIVNHLTLVEEETLETDQTATIPAEPALQSREAVTILGLKGLLTTMARCCNPTPGDAIIGYITRGRGATIHRMDCPNIMRIRDRERLVRVSWGEPKNTYPVPVRIKAWDRNGLMKDVSTLITEEGINMAKVNVDVNRKNFAVFDLILEVRDLAQLSKVLDRLENLPNVLEAHRVRPG
jgi:GTP pyrophosphokinase